MNLISIRRRGLVHLMAQSKIQLVDDEIKTRQLLSRLLSNQGLKVQTASDGEKDLIKANEFQPNCILLDVRMPMVDLSCCPVLEKNYKIPSSWFPRLLSPIT